MAKSVFTTVIFIVVGVASVQAADIDSTTSHTRSSIDMSLGAGVGMLGVGYDAALFFEKETYLIGVKYVVNHEVRNEFAVAGNPGFSRPIESVWGMDLVAGGKMLRRGFSASMTAGIGLFGGSLRGRMLYPSGSYTSYDEYQHRNETVVCFPFEGRLAFTPDPSLDLGISAIVNVNSKRTITGLLLSFRFHHSILL